jgi:branched-chain amino acid transport system substrate-binding protein
MNANQGAAALETIVDLADWMKRSGRAPLGFIVACLAVFGGMALAAEKHYGPGVTDTEIRIGQTMSYSGPVSAYGVIGHTETAYIKALNEAGGINGRKVDFLSLDDGYSPAKALEQTRRLVEQDEVLAIMGTLGTPTNLATRKYLNDKGVPQFFIASGAGVFQDPARFPWTIPLDSSYRSEGRAYAKYILETRPGAKLAVIYQDDELGKEYLDGLRSGLGARADAMIVATASYETTDPSINSQIITLQGAGADTLMEFGTGKFVSQAIRKSYDMDWHPAQFVASIAASVAASLKPAGLEKSVGVISASHLRDPSEPGARDDPEMKLWLDFMTKHYPEGDPDNAFTLFGYSVAIAMTESLRRCGDDLTRDHLLDVVRHFDGVRVPVLIPGAGITVTPTDYESVKQMRLRRFDGNVWVPIPPKAP